MDKEKKIIHPNFLYYSAAVLLLLLIIGKITKMYCDCLAESYLVTIFKGRE
jgi:hypothetical protein